MNKAQKSMKDIAIPKNWENLAEKCIGKNKCMVIGGVDTGKTTLIHYLQENTKGNIVDADIGQSDIGPPTVISLSHNGKKQHEGFFVGTTSPNKHLSEIILGTKKMVEKAKSPVFIDTTGLIKGKKGRKLKTNKIEAIEPDFLIIIGNNELNFYKNFQNQKTEIQKIPKPKKVSKKTNRERKKFREKKFAKYFKKTKTTKINLTKTKTRNTILGNREKITQEIEKISNRKIYWAEKLGKSGIIISDQNRLKNFNYKLVKARKNLKELHVLNKNFLKNILIGLTNKKNRHIGLAILEKIDFNDLSSKIIIPKKIKQKPHSIKVGSIKISKNGKEQGSINIP